MEDNHVNKYANDLVYVNNRKTNYNDVIHFLTCYNALGYHAQSVPWHNPGHLQKN